MSVSPILCFGFLIDRFQYRMRRLGSCVAVFHWAFDVVAVPFDSFERLIDLGVRRVLTSGQKASAREGAALIAELIRRNQGRVEILPSWDQSSDGDGRAHRMQSGACVARSDLVGSGLSRSIPTRSFR